MSSTNRIPPLYLLFLALMALTALLGVALLIYGSVHQGTPVPRIAPTLARLGHG